MNLAGGDLNMQVDVLDALSKFYMPQHPRVREIYEKFLQGKLNLQKPDFICLGCGKDPHMVDSIFCEKCYLNARLGDPPMKMENIGQPKTPLRDTYMGRGDN